MCATVRTQYKRANENIKLIATGNLLAAEAGRNPARISAADSPEAQIGPDRRDVAAENAARIKVQLTRVGGRR